MSPSIPRLGLGIGWRSEIAHFIERREGLSFVEVVAENMCGTQGIPAAIDALRERGVRVIPHGISLSLGGAEPLDRSRVKELARLAKRLDAPLVSEHIAFVRGGGVEAGHLLPVPRTHEQINVLAHNIAMLQSAVDVPVAVENIAALFEWPDADVDEATFLAEILDRTGAHLLLDLANVHANTLNLGTGLAGVMDQSLLDRVAYVHVAGGELRDGVYYDTHAHRTPPEVFALVEALAQRADVPGFMLERDDHFPTDDELTLEMDDLARAWNAGRTERDRRVA